LVRQILLNIEHRGANCPLDALRSDLRHESDDRVHYHLQLTIDAGLVAGMDRSVAGPFEVWLTHAGHEFMEVARGDARWRAAKAMVIEETGGQSLSMLRALLTRWGWRTIVRGERRLRAHRHDRRYVESTVPPHWADAFAANPESMIHDEAGMVPRDARRPRLSPRGDWCNDLYGDLAEELDERRPSVTLPPHVI
jgi:hypothetical protein